MDPDANLTEQRKLSARVLSRADIVDDAEDIVDDAEDIVDDAVRLAELVQALDGWISKGWPLPTAWRRR